MEGEGRADEVAFDCAGNLLQGAKGGGGTRTRTWQKVLRGAVALPHLLYCGPSADLRSHPCLLLSGLLFAVVCMSVAVC